MVPRARRTRRPQPSREAVERQNPPEIPKYGGFKKLKSFRMAQLVREVTELFCETFADEDDRSCVRMVHEASNGADKIAAGSVAGGESKKNELALTKQSRASLESLRLLYVDFLTRRELTLWDAADPRTTELVTRRPRTLDDVLQWAAWAEACGQNGPGRPSGQEQETPSTGSIPAETLANGALTLISLVFALIDRQVSAQTRVVQHEERVAEQLRRRRLAEWPG